MASRVPNRTSVSTPFLTFSIVALTGFLLVVPGSCPGGVPKGDPALVSGRLAASKPAVAPCSAPAIYRALPAINRALGGASYRRSIPAALAKEAIMSSAKELGAHQFPFGPHAVEEAVASTRRLAGTLARRARR